MQSVSEFLVDLNTRLTSMPAAHIDERRPIERELSALEDEIGQDLVGAVGRAAAPERTVVIEDWSAR